MTADIDGLLKLLSCYVQPFDWIKAQLPGGATSEAGEGESTA